MIAHCPAESIHFNFFTPVTAHWWIPTTAEVDVLHSNPSKVTPLQLGHCMSQRVEGAQKIVGPAGLCTSRREVGPSYNKNSCFIVNLGRMMLPQLVSTLPLF